MTTWITIDATSRAADEKNGRLRPDDRKKQLAGAQTATERLLYVKARHRMLAFAAGRTDDTMKDVLVFLSPAPGDRLSAGAHYALALARVHGAHLSALIAEIAPDPSGLPPAVDLGQADEARTPIKPLSGRLERTGELLLSAAKLANVTCAILESGSGAASLRERLIDCAQVRDVVVVDVYGPLQYARKDLVDGVLFASGRPVILVPPGARAFAEERIVVAWDATRSAVRAVHDALPLLVRASDVTIVSVIGDKTLSTPYSGHELCRYLARWNVAAKFNAINRESLNVGMTLLAHARQADADLLVMGGFAHGFERTLMLGSATQDIFRTSPDMPIFLSH